MATNIPNSVTSINHSCRRTPGLCTVCGDAARYSYFGAIVCPSCKMFFKRNANNLQRKIKCNYNCSCEINIHTRQRCSYCRLARCFSMGMDSQMIRPPRIIQNKNQQTKDFTSNSTYTSLTRTIQPRQPEQLPTLNLVRADLSQFSRDEWDLLSNIIHCFDEHVGYAFTQDFIKHQNTLPPKLRFRSTPLLQYLAIAMNNVQVVVDKNRDFLSLPSDDRVTLLRMTAQYIINLGGSFLVRHYQLLDDPYYYRSVQTIFQSTIVSITKYIIDRLDPDETFIKLIFSLLSFSTINYTDYRRNDMTTLNDTRRIISIQDMYTSLVWKYLLHRYGHEQAVKRFSKLIQCLFYVIDFVRQTHQSNQFNQLVDVVVEETKQTLHL